MVIQETHGYGRGYAPPHDLSDSTIQSQLEEKIKSIKREIQRELKIKEGAENLRKATTDKKALQNVSTVVKEANNKLAHLHSDLNELNAHLLVANNKNASTGK